jgi:hypothetical protein
MGTALLLVSIISFSGFASAATISNSGSNVYYHTSTDKYINNWYITSANTASSTFVFKATNQKHTSKGWNTVFKFMMTMNFLKVSKTTTKMTDKSYANGKLAYSKSTTVKTKLTALNNAKAIEKIELPYLKTSL